MNISQILAYFASEFGGPIKVARGLGDQLESFGLNVNYWATSECLKKEDRLKNLNVFDVSRPKSWYFSSDLTKALKKQLINIDLLHIHEIWSYPQFIAASMAGNKNIPYIFVPHGELEPWRVNQKKTKKKIYLQLILKKLLNNSSCVHAITEMEVAGIRNAGYEGPIAVIPNGISPESLDDLPDKQLADEYWPKLKNKRALLYLARISPEKGLDILIPAFKRLISHESCDDIILVIAGPDFNGYKRKIEFLIKELGVEKNILFTGMLDGRRKKTILAKTDYFVSPSYSEGFSISCRNIPCKILFNKILSIFPH